MEPEYEKWMRENKPDLYKQMCEDRAWATQWRDDLIELLEPQVAELEDELFAAGRMDNPPCFVCGYNGESYYNPKVHPCAARHHAALREEEHPIYPTIDVVGEER